MKPAPLRVASPRFTRKVLTLRWLCDAIFVLKCGLSSPLTRCEPPNYCRWVKQKNRNSVLCARPRESFFAGFSDLASCGGVGGADAVEAIGEKLPDKSKKCPRPEPFAPSFFGLNGVARTSPGAARRLCRSVPPWGPPRACAPREVRGSRPNNGRLKWAFSLYGGRNGLEIHCGVRKNIVVFWGEMK